MNVATSGPYGRHELLAQQLFQDHQQRIYREMDRLFTWLLAAQWVFGFMLAVWVSPLSWAGLSSSVHPHIGQAILLGGAIISVPFGLSIVAPGTIPTRHMIAVAQMLMSALLVHLSGGRIETHFHAFGSLALLAFYRDWRVLATATTVIAVEHLVRGVLWPQSVFGTVDANLLRPLEHMATSARSISTQKSFHCCPVIVQKPIQPSFAAKIDGTSSVRPNGSGPPARLSHTVEFGAMVSAMTSKSDTSTWQPMPVRTAAV